MMAETYLLQALQAGISSIRQTPSLLASILLALNAQEQAAAQAWFANPNNQITIAPGFPMETTHLPFIGVTVAEETQIDSYTGIGLIYDVEYNADGSVSHVYGARFSGALKATIYTPDANLIIWISTVCKWALLSQYDWLGSMGFNNLNVSIGDFEPRPDFLPVITFARGVVLRGEYDLVYRQDYSAQTITQINAGGTY